MLQLDNMYTKRSNLRYLAQLQRFFLSLIKAICIVSFTSNYKAINSIETVHDMKDDHTFDVTWTSYFD